MVSTPQTPTHGALARFRTEVTSSTQMLTSWASFKSEGLPFVLPRLRSRACAARPVPGVMRQSHVGKAVWGGGGFPGIR